MIRFREHRGGLEESLKTTREFDTPAEVREHLYYLFGSILVEGVTSEPYSNQADGGDDRMGWKNVHILKAPKWGVLGFMEGPLS